MNKVIEKWKLNKGLLAEKMNMPLGTFCNKLSPKHTSKFSDSEIITLKLVLREMNADIADAIEIDFNDALNVLINKKQETFPPKPSPPPTRIIKEGGYTKPPNY